MESRWFEMASLGALLLLPALTSPVLLQPAPARAALNELEPQSAAGDLDPSFGNGGKVTTGFSGNDDIATCVAIQSDGKIVVGGTSAARQVTLTSPWRATTPTAASTRTSARAEK